MLAWFTRKKNSKDELPVYSGLQLNPNRGLPTDLQEMETGEAYRTRREAIERELLEPDRQDPTDEAPFTELLSAGGEGVVTVTLPDNAGQCLPVFSTPIRAGDYVQTLLADGPSVHYLCSSPLEFVSMLRDMEAKGIDKFAPDPCPRCSSFTLIGIDSVKAVSDVLAVRAIFRATHLARADLYLRFALDAARSGQLEVARDVGLETIGHVTMEDPRLHLLLGQLGVGLRDNKLIQEAKTFLGFLRLDEWERELDYAIRSGSPDFAGSADVWR